MITYICFILAGVCIAVADTITHHFVASVFRKLNPRFWNAEISWKNKYKMDTFEQLPHHNGKLVRKTFHVYIPILIW